MRIVADLAVVERGIRAYNTVLAYNGIALEDSSGLQHRVHDARYITRDMVLTGVYHGNTAEHAFLFLAAVQYLADLSQLQHIVYAQDLLKIHHKRSDDLAD